MNIVYKITAKVLFPEGVSPGAGANSNRMIVARNGKGETLLRGSAFAGVLRSEYARILGVESEDEKVSRWFGAGLDGERENCSIVLVTDLVIKCNSVVERTHTMVNRHTGAVAKKALFSIEAIPPMATALLSISIRDDVDDKKEYEEFIQTLINILGSDLLVGGSSNRGVGRLIIDEAIYIQEYNLDTLDGASEWLDTEYSERINGIELAGKELIPSGNKEKLIISLELGIPPGQDLLIGDGQDIDYALQPQSIHFADGSEHWRIPGSSLRGIIRGWMTRVAVRDGKGVCDSVDNFENNFTNYEEKEFANLTGWGFLPKQEQKRLRKILNDKEKTFEEKMTILKEATKNDPILDLFGSMYKKGRIHIADSFSRTLKDSDVSERMHVAIDRFSGGANEGALFDNQVLTEPELRFPVIISMEKPQEQEIGWLLKTLRALHFGILAVGSSKSAGRLEIKTITARGPLAEKIETFSLELN